MPVRKELAEQKTRFAGESKVCRRAHNLPVRKGFAGEVEHNTWPFIFVAFRCQFDDGRGREGEVYRTLPQPEPHEAQER